MLVQRIAQTNCDTNTFDWTCVYVGMYTMDRTSDLDAQINTSKRKKCTPTAIVDLKP